MTDLAQQTTPAEVGGESDIVHLTCCVEQVPVVALCGWNVAGERELGPDAEPECVVCADIADGLGGCCPRGGRCPE